MLTLTLGKRGKNENELSMPVSVVVDDCHDQEQVYVLDPGNCRIKCLSIDGKFLEHLCKNEENRRIVFFLFRSNFEKEPCLILIVFYFQQPTR